MQTRLSSVTEACLNTASGFALSFVVWHYVAEWFSIPMSHTENLKITAIFTVVSVVRSYVWRRVFNRRLRSNDSSRFVQCPGYASFVRCLADPEYRCGACPRNRC